MSALKPAQKRARTNKPTPVKEPAIESNTPVTIAVENAPHTGTPQSPMPTQPQTVGAIMKVNHPKGHKVRNLKEVWGSMDSQAYLRLVDTLTLSDVWVQPLSVIPEKGGIATVELREMVYARHIKVRTAKTKIAVDDLTKMLYLTDCLIWDLSGVEHISFDEWLNEKISNCVRDEGLEAANERAILCNYIITKERTFTFFPSLLKGKFGIFFRKICVHSYKDAEGITPLKLTNPSMIKCKAVRSDFEYLIEARILPLPDQWYDTIDTTIDCPPTQKLDDDDDDDDKEDLI